MKKIPKFIIRNESMDSWFKQWTNIGPMFTDKPSEAMMVDDKMEFALYMNHSGMIGYNIIEL